MSDMRRHAARRKIRRAIRTRELMREKNVVFVILAIVVAVSVTAAFTRHVLAARHQVRVLDCPVAHAVAHHHDDSCYDDNGNLVCPLPERDLHVHDESCYAQVGDDYVLTCGQDEITEEHVHGPGCFHTLSFEEADPDKRLAQALNGETTDGIEALSGNALLAATSEGARVVADDEGASDSKAGAAKSGAKAAGALRAAGATRGERSVDVTGDDTDLFDGNNKFIIWAQGSDDNYYALKGDGSTAQIDPNDIDSLGQDFQWTIEYGWENGGDRWVIRPLSDTRRSLALNSGYHGGSDLVPIGRNGVHLYAPHTSHKSQQNDSYSDDNAGWILEGWNWSRLNLGYTSHVFECHPEYCSENINITMQEELSHYEFTVKTEDIRKGAVTGKDADGADQSDAREYDAVTNETAGEKTNLYSIKANPVSSGKYLFDYWDLNGTQLDLGAEIAVSELTIPSNGSTLTAHFKKNPDYVVPDEEKDGHAIDKEELDAWLDRLTSRKMPFDESGCQKTAELYDYENRIYRVDLTAQSSIETFVGDIDLGFMLDVSSSMKFPARLRQVLDDVDVNHLNDSSQNQAWLDHNTTYYVISDKGSTATVYELRWGTWQIDRDQWMRTATGWGFKDASKDDSNMRYIVNATVWSGGESGEFYPVYVDDDPGHTRSYYLERSIDNTVSKLNTILNALSISSDPGRDPKVKVAWNTFAKWIQGSQHDFVSVQGSTISPTYSYSGGTSIDLAMLDAAGKKRSDDTHESSRLQYEWQEGMSYSDVDGFHWEKNAVKFAVLITDGAPQRNGIDVGRSLVEPSVEFMKAGKDGTLGTDDDVKLMTVGLSMGDVKKGSVLLYDISDRDTDGEPLFYKAQTGDELQYALYQTLRQTIAPAIVQSDITDTVNEAFYPVDKGTGAPLADGNVISLQGVKLADSVDGLSDEQKKAGYGTIHQSGDTYTVTWSDQDVYSADKGGWHGTVYEKAKEDFLGGNTVRTNDPGAEATVQAKSYKMAPDATPIALKNELVNGPGHVELKSPRVNVNELSIPALNTEWTVYLGTQVDDPLDQLKEFYNNIKVYQVVTKNGSVDTDGDGFKDKINGDVGTSYCFDMMESALDNRTLDVAADAQEFFLLKDLIRKISGQDDLDWNELVRLSGLEGDANTGITFPYDLYGQDCPGSITFRLRRNHDFGAHATTTVGDAVEAYTLEMLFTPSYEHIPAGLGGENPWEYHTGEFGLCDYGNAAGTEDREYAHVINVFAKRLEIEKIDQMGETITGSPVEFRLYREAQGDDIPLAADKVPSALPAGKSYVFVDRLNTGTTGKATTSVDLAKLPNDAPYYLVETGVPDGFLPLGGAFEVRAMTEEETSSGMVPKDVWTKVPVSDPPETSSTKWSPYVLSNWEQNATLVVKGTGELAGFATLAHQVAYDHNQDEGSATVTYKIRNDAGAELPAAGGPGVVVGTVAGVVLVVAGTLVLRLGRGRRRMR